MLMFNLLEHSPNYSDTTGCLWFYSNNEATDFNNAIANTTDFKSFEYQAKFMGDTEVDRVNGVLINTTTTVSLKLSK